MNRYSVSLLFLKYETNSTGYSINRAMRIEIVSAMSYEEALGITIKKHWVGHLANHALEMYSYQLITDQSKEVTTE